MQFAVMAVDYFTKWVKAESLVVITKMKMENFVEQNIVSRFRIPQVLIINNTR